MTIEVLYPEIANLYGDLSNVEYLTRCAPDLAVHTTRLADTPLFAEQVPSLVYLGGTTEAGQALVAERLRPHVARLRQLIDDGTPFLVTGNALEIFGQRIEEAGKPPLTGLGLFGQWAKRDMIHRHNSLYLGQMTELGEAPVVGFKSQFAMSYGDPGADPLFTTRRGVGLGPDIPGEGIRCHNFMATYLLGPLLILNPAFTAYLLKLVGAADPTLAYADQIWASYRARVAEFQVIQGFSH